MSTKSHPCPLHPVPCPLSRLRLRALRDLRVKKLRKRLYETKWSLILSSAILDRLENSRVGTRCERTKRFHFVASARVSRFATLCQHIAQQRLTNAGRRKVKTKPLKSSSASGYCLKESSLPMTKPFPIGPLAHSVSVPANSLCTANSIRRPSAAACTPLPLVLYKIPNRKLPVSCGKLLFHRMNSDTVLMRTQEMSEPSSAPES
jgi:hypothetical protein